jgi:hypothetical protein
VHSVAPNTLKTEYEDMKLEELVKNGKLEPISIKENLATP